MLDSERCSIRAISLISNCLIFSEDVLESLIKAKLMILQKVRDAIGYEHELHVCSVHICVEI